MIQLAQTASQYPNRAAPSVLDTFRAEHMASALHRPIPSPEPDPEPNPGPDAINNGHINGNSNISAADWDELFHAIQARLENCVDDALLKAPELPPLERHQVIKTTVLQCVEAMQQLHTALRLEREQATRKASEQTKLLNGH